MSYWIKATQTTDSPAGEWTVIYKRPDGSGSTLTVDYQTAQLIEIARIAGQDEAKREIRKALGL